ncbi:MAG: LysR family transcriptional regulator [Gemmatimonadaceae bacterium]
MRPLNSINFQHLLYFWTVAREGSIARATGALNLSQPTISAQLRAFESSLGERLFERRGRGLQLTDVGREVFRYADEIFGIASELLGTLEGAVTSRPARFVVGVSDALPKITTFRLLEPAFALGDRMRVILRIDKTDRLLADLSIHAIDLVLADAPVSPTLGVRLFNHLLGETDVTVFGTRVLAARYRKGFPGSLNGAPFLVQTRNTTLRRSLEEVWAREGIVPRLVCEVEDAALVQELGGQGLGLFAAPSVVTAQIKARYDVQPVGRLSRVTERFYAISAERRLKHPAVVAISNAARERMFGGERTG